MSTVVLINPYAYSAGGGGSTPITSPALADEITSLSPLVYLKLDDTSGTTAVDSSGNGRDGTYAGTYTLANEAGPDGTNYLDLTDGRVTIPDESVFDLGAGYGLTLFACVKRASGTYIINKGGTGSDYEFAFNAAGTGTVYSEAGGNRSSAATTESEPGDVWSARAVHLPNNAVLCDIETYLNSAVDTAGSPSSSTSDAFDPTPTNDVWIGDRADGAAGHLVGGIAHVAIFADSVDLTGVFGAAIGEGWTSVVDGGDATTTNTDTIDGGDAATTPTYVLDGGTAA